MKVVVRESTMVKPAEETPKVKLWNSCLDLIAPNFYTLMVYFYWPNGAPNFFDTKVMKDGLSRALVAFYPIAGRLRQGKDGRSEIDCQGQGVLFLEAESDGVIDDFAEFAPQLELLKIFPYQGIDLDLLLVLQESVCTIMSWMGCLRCTSLTHGPIWLVALASLSHLS
ncbi:shikimate O-hydroxycinnamoyltransferase [Helianthus annuus]|uniref:shikimate O-hydroxycinnamoyltransferase n=1 Tax=Helianthus annuus TaxID=4232 RepID=UPI0016532B50|nr:shikimate O-hydroxycinnamoyltransferase [Helianthus annuus]